MEPPSLSLGQPDIAGKGGIGGPFSGFSFGGQPKLAMGGPSSGKVEGMSIDLPDTSSAGMKPPLPPTLAMRRASLPKNHVNIHGPAITMSSSPLAPSSRPRALGTGQLGPVLAKPTTLILDLRPPSSYQSSHLPQSHSLPIPSTLLRRPAFTIQKLTQMLSATSMEAVSHWREKSDIVMVDQDSGSVPDGSVMDGLASKFTREGYSGHLWFIKGGHRAVQTSGTELVGVHTANDDGSSVSPLVSNGGLMAGGMGRTAFQQSKSSPTYNKPSRL